MRLFACGAVLFFPAWASAAQVKGTLDPPVVSGPSRTLGYTKTRVAGPAKGAVHRGDVAVFLKRVLPSAGLVVLPQSGHTINLEEPALFNAAVLEFFRLVEADRWARRSQVTTSMLPAEAAAC